MPHDPGSMAYLRDLVIVVAGVIWAVAGLATSVAAWTTWRVVRGVPRQIGPVIAPAHELVERAHDAAAVVGEHVRTHRGQFGSAGDTVARSTARVASTLVGAHRRLHRKS